MNVDSRQCQNDVEKHVTSGFCDKEDKEKEPGTDVVLGRFSYNIYQCKDCFGKIGTWQLSSMVPLLVASEGDSPSSSWPRSNWGRSYRSYQLQYSWANNAKHEALQTFFWN